MPLMMKIIMAIMSEKITVIKTQRNEHADYLASSFDEGAGPQNHK